jgi:hypothetical protein
LGSLAPIWLPKASVRMSASHPKATEMLRDNEVTQSAITGREQMQHTNVRECGTFVFFKPVVSPVPLEPLASLVIVVPVYL